MTDLEFVIQHMLETANQLDSRGKVVEAGTLDQHARRIATAGYGGGAAEYVGKLLELARNKGIDYMKSRMQESRIVTLNDGTPILKENDDPGFINAVVSRARNLKLPETKGLTPNSPGKIDDRWSDEFANRMEEIQSGKSSWLAQAKPFSDAMEEKKQKHLQWEPPQPPKPAANPFAAMGAAPEPPAASPVTPRPFEAIRSDVETPAPKPAADPFDVFRTGKGTRAKS